MVPVSMQDRFGYIIKVKKIYTRDKKFKSIGFGLRNKVKDGGVGID